MMVEKEQKDRETSAERKGWYQKGDAGLGRAIRRKRGERRPRVGSNALVERTATAWKPSQSPLEAHGCETLLPKDEA